MKAIVLLATFVFCSLGCLENPDVSSNANSKKGEKVDLNKILARALELERLQQRGDLFYQPNEEEPFTGWVLKMHPGKSQVETLGLIENGQKIVWLEFYSFIHTYNFLRPKFDRKKLSINYKNGKMDGIFEKWYGNGQRAERGGYKLGLKEGEWIAWNQKGTAIFKGSFADGKENGIHLSWWENNQPQKSQDFKNGILNGISWETYKNGQKKFEGEYLEGKKEGEWIYWKENGEKVKTESYSKGELQ